MQTMRGKYNSANIFIDTELESTTRSQIQNFLNHPAFKKGYIAIMPDAHAGAGAVIGFTQNLKNNDYIIPNVTGVDIGCGVLSYNIGNVDADWKSLDEFIRKNIPSGFNVRNKVPHTSYGGHSYREFKTKIEQLSEKIGSDAERNKKSLGTLGGGNHFIEGGMDEHEDKWITVHTGSRKFGLDVAVYHQKKAKKLMEKMFIATGAFKELEFLPRDMGGEEYLADMKIAQKFAEYNRFIILDEIIKYLGVEIKEKVESVHNCIDFSDNIIRKGAIRAYKGEKIVIPFNMEFGLIIGEGKSNSKWNYSAPHGAGRILSRGRAKRELKMADFVNDMKGIYTTSVKNTTLDESPRAYKNPQIIIDAIEETVEITNNVKPEYSFKSG